MKPQSPHWADITASRIISQRGDKDCYVVASGITPSGKIHVGNFREVITVDLVARALRDHNKSVRFIYSWDDFDTFRKVPKNLPDPKKFTEFLRRPIARIPDPWANAESYAQGRIVNFEHELKEVGIFPEYIYQQKQYASGVYANQIRKALENVDTIRAILNEHKTTPLPENWLPTSIYCEQCERDEMVYEKYDGGWDYSYKCASCSFETTTKINQTKNLKLAWRTDWPMRWAFEKVDFEPGGKDHSSQGGSYDTGKKIVKEVWGEEAPIYLQYDFVMIKGGTGKMSSSSGELFTLSEILDVYDPQIVRWIFAGHRPNHDFSLAFDEDVIKIYDEFDRAERTALGPCPEKPGKWPLIRRTYELSLVDGKVPEKVPFRAGFRELSNRLQICSGDIDRVIERYYKNDIKSETDLFHFNQRAQCCLNWLQKHAAEEFKYSVYENRVEISLTEKQQQCLQSLRQIVSEYDLTSIESKKLNEIIYEKAIHATDCEPKEGFKAIYQKLIGRDQGPRLPGFLKEIGKDRLLTLL
ncbi:MAG: lysine--tRNA ligase [Bdellovibrionota bacterium]